MRDIYIFAPLALGRKYNAVDSIAGPKDNILVVRQFFYTYIYVYQRRKSGWCEEGGFEILRKDLGHHLADLIQHLMILIEVACFNGWQSQLRLLIFLLPRCI